MDFFPDVVRYSIRARGSGTCGFCELCGDFFLAYPKVVDVGGEVDIRLGRGWASWEEVVEEGRVDAIRGVLVREGGKAGLLPAAGEFLCLPH